jgi:hypothetical protein
VPNKVFILGAGASKHTGAPLMADFLDRARDLYAAGKLPSEWADHFGRVFRIISALQAVHSKSTLDIRNLESVFTTFEMLKSLGQFPDLAGDEIELSVQSLQAVIFYTLDQFVRFPTGNAGEILPPKVYHGFAERIRATRNVTVITFNYDVGLDVALAASGIPVFYDIGDPPPLGDFSKLLKLHGSTSWSTDKESKKVVACPAEALTRSYLGKQRSHSSLNLAGRLKQIILEKFACASYRRSGHRTARTIQDGLSRLACTGLEVSGDSA